MITYFKARPPGLAPSRASSHKSRNIGAVLDIAESSQVRAIGETAGYVPWLRIREEALAAAAAYADRVAREATMSDSARPKGGLRAMADLATPMAVRVAATLRIADHVQAG